MDRSLIYPKGIIKKVLIIMDKFIFPVDFIVLDIDEDKNMYIILRRPFFTIGRTMIDVKKEELIMRIQD